MFDDRKTTERQVVVKPEIAALYNKLGQIISELELSGFFYEFRSAYGSNVLSIQLPDLDTANAMQNLIMSRYTVTGFNAEVYHADTIGRLKISVQIDGIPFTIDMYAFPVDPASFLASKTITIHTNN